MTKTKIAILQRVITNYRLPIFQALSEKDNLDILYLYGSSYPAPSKVVNTKNIENIKSIKLKTKFVKICNRTFPFHVGLFRKLYHFKPDIIICEGESNFISYLKAILYRKIYIDTKIIHWSLGGIPGKPTNFYIRILKKFLYKNFDVFLVYSSFGKKELTKFCVNSNKIVLAVNVSDTQRCFDLWKLNSLNKHELRNKINIPDKFTIIYAGALEKNKNIEFLIKSIYGRNKIDVNLLLIGNGPEKDNLINLCKCLQANNYFFINKLPWIDLSQYYLASDLFVLPGRGGMVISEAMAFALPVIAFQADGTEHDFIINNKTGILLQNKSEIELNNMIKELIKNKNYINIGLNAQNYVLKNFSLFKMVQKIEEAIDLARGK